MNEDNQLKKIILTTLSALLFGSLFFIFGIAIEVSILPLIINYIIAIMLYTAAYLAAHNNNKDKNKVLKYIEYLSLFMMIFITIVLFNQIM